MPEQLSIFGSRRSTRLDSTRRAQPRRRKGRFHYIDGWLPQPEGTQKATMIHIFRIYSEPGFGSLPNLFFRAKAGSLIVPVLIPSRRNALHSGGVGGAATCSTRVFTRLQRPTFPSSSSSSSFNHPAPSIDFFKLFALASQSRPFTLTLVFFFFFFFFFLFFFSTRCRQSAKPNTIDRKIHGEQRFIGWIPRRKRPPIDRHGYFYFYRNGSLLRERNGGYRFFDAYAISTFFSVLIQLVLPSIQFPFSLPFSLWFSDDIYAPYIRGCGEMRGRAVFSTQRYVVVVA